MNDSNASSSSAASNRNDSGGSGNRLASSNRSAPETLGQPGREFLGRVRRAATNVLADSKTGREVLELCDDHAEARRMILDDRSSGLTVVAVVGATGQGKSWFCLLYTSSEPTRPY